MQHCFSRLEIFAATVF